MFVCNNAMSERMQSIAVCDANTAVAEIAYMLSNMCFLYPITPCLFFLFIYIIRVCLASPMGEHADELSASGKKNLFGDVVPIVQMQSEGGVAGALHGAILSGSLCTTFTCSQGLLLMIPEMYKMAGEMLPAVIHISSRTVCSQAMNIHSDHSDILATRQSGWAILSSHSVQQAADFALIAHVSTLQSSCPFTHFFDGFRVSHEIQKIEMPKPELLNAMMDMEILRQWRRERSLRNDEPTMRGLVQSTEEYMPLVEASNKQYREVIECVKGNLQKFSRLTGRKYCLFDYFGHPQAEHVIVAMGTACKTIEEYLNWDRVAKNTNRKFGLIAVHLYHPFSISDFVQVIPDSCKHITIMDRTKEPGAVGEPLYLECLGALHQTGRLVNSRTGEILQIHACRYGLGGRDITPTTVYQIFENSANTEMNPTHRTLQRFTVGINDDVTHLSLPFPPSPIVIQHPERYEALFYGFGADGTVGSIKDAIKIIGLNTDRHVQAHFVYDAKKSGGVTVSHARFGCTPILSQYEIQSADYIGCHHPSYLQKYSMLEFAKPGATFVVNCSWNTSEDVLTHFPHCLLRTIVEKHIKVYTIDAERIASKCSLSGKINNILQTVFFELSGIIKPTERAIRLQKEFIQRTYSLKGEDIVQKNWTCVDEALKNIHEISISSYPPRIKEESNLGSQFSSTGCNFFDYIAKPTLARLGKTLHVSDFMPYKGGVFPTNTSRFEHRSIAQVVPEWNPISCIQCNVCSFVCAHAAIRPFILREEDTGKCPKFTVLRPNLSPKDKEEKLYFTIGISNANCVGCGTCVSVCPTNSLIMIEYNTTNAIIQDSIFAYLTSRESICPLFQEIPDQKNIPIMSEIQFREPLFEFPGACGGCSEAPLARLITQMFGERLLIANTCGCSHVWGGTFPTSPYGINTGSGLGPSITGSLFEDTAEMGYGLARSIQLQRDVLLSYVDRVHSELENETWGAKLMNTLQLWKASYNDASVSLKCYKIIIQILDSIPKEIRMKKSILSEIWIRRDLINKKSVWVFGGDGWAYDIDFGGLDHVLRSGANLNVLVMDTEVYSNTGGQKSKATPIGAVAKFAASGKESLKKDLGMYAIQLKTVYVGVVAQGANPQQLVKAVFEAESYAGTSLIIALCPCALWGIRRGQGYSMLEQKKAVQCGYWPLYRYNPELRHKGINAFHLDSPKPSISISEFLQGENRFQQLRRKNPLKAAEVELTLQKQADERYTILSHLSES